ncbi:MAG: hypothetical protein V3U73_10100, partial [bacterium]
MILKECELLLDIRWLENLTLGILKSTAGVKDFCRYPFLRFSANISISEQKKMAEIILNIMA